MEIQKLGHCCLIIKSQGKTILTDPGVFTEHQNGIIGIDIVLITHEHQDHFHIHSVKKVLENNPQAIIVTNTAVGKLLDNEGLKYQILEDGQSRKFDELLIEGSGKEHATIHSSLPRVQNTGYFVSGRMYFPGDSFHDPGRSIEILALPVAGPWMKISEAIDYALKLKPVNVFPVHDGFLKSPGVFHNIPKMILEPKGIKFVLPENGIMKF